MSLLDCSAAFVGSLLQLHHKCGMQRLNNTEDEQQEDNPKGNS
jgi:hypothetical protein